MTDQPVAAARLGYAEAMTELDAIVARLEADDVDIDALADDVARAGELIQVCRERLRATGARVERLLADLDDEADSVG